MVILLFFLFLGRGAWETAGSRGAGGTDHLWQNSHNENTASSLSSCYNVFFSIYSGCSLTILSFFGAAGAGGGGGGTRSARRVAGHEFDLLILLLAPGT